MRGERRAASGEIHSTGSWRYFFLGCLISQLSLLASPIAAQPLRIEYFTVNDGLSTRDVNDLHIGKDGFLWVATMDGLNRFDGQAFLNFRQGDTAQGGLSRGSIATIRADNEDKLVLTFRDFYGFYDRFDPRDFTVEQVRLAPSTGVIGYPRTITTDRDGRTFAVTIGEEGTILYEYFPEGFRELCRQPDDGWTTFAPRVELLPLENGQFLLYDEEHDFRVISANGVLLGKLSIDAARPRRFHAFAEGPDGYVYLAFRDGYPLWRWRPGTGNRPEPVPGLDDGLFYPYIYRDELGQLMFVGSEDLFGQPQPDEYYLLDTAGRFSIFEEPLPQEIDLTAMAAVNWRETTYLGLRDGLGVIERYVNPVRTYLENPGGETINQHLVTGLCTDGEDRTYVLERDGQVYYLDAGSDRLDTLSLVYAESGTRVSFRDGRALLYDSIGQAVWGAAQIVGRQSGGLLFRYDLPSATTETYRTEYPLVALAQLPDGTLYAAGTDPARVSVLLRFDAESEELNTVDNFNPAGEPNAGIRINALLATADSQLLIGTDDRGLLSYDPVRDEVHFEQGQDDAFFGLQQLTINTILKADLRGYWIGTDAGLQRIYDGEVRENIGRRDGLSSNTVLGIVPDTSGGLWLSTRNGLVHLPADRPGGQFRRYYQEDGLSNDEFLPGAALCDRTGRYFFGGVNGLTVFRDADLSSQSAGADVMLTEVILYSRGKDRRVNTNISRLNQVTVLAHEKGVAFSFALPVGQRPSSSRIRVKLDGFDDDWQELRNERTVRYNNLKSGHYELQVQGAGANGNYGTGIYRLDVHVRQYIYEKLWAQATILLLIGGLLFYNFREKSRAKLNNEKLRTQLSSNIHDEVGGLLAGITLQAELLKSRTQDEDMRNRLHKVGDAGRSAMSKLSDIIWSIDSRRDTIGNLLQRMQEHADEILLPLDIRYDFTAVGFDPEDELPGNIRQDLYLLFKEALNNIARHSQATRVEIRLEQFAQTFELFIRDNGKGQPVGEAAGAVSSKQGQGKDNIQMRAARLRAELEVVTE